MKHYSKHFIGGRWQSPSAEGEKALIDPFSETAFARVSNGGTALDVDLAVAAARQAFPSFSASSVAEKVALIDRIIACYQNRADDIANLMAREVGIPVSARAQVTGPLGHMKVARELVSQYLYETRLENTIIRREAIGVCALISPWNWPIQTPVIKVIYGLAAGCTVILKPSDASPVSGIILAEIFEEAGVPAGVFNLVLGPGNVVGSALAGHPGVDMVSFTGSTLVGGRVGEAAAATIKRVSLELGGKSANVVLADADLEAAARWNVRRCFFNSGQSCHAPSRMLVPRALMDEAIGYLVDESTQFNLGDPRNPRTTMGPLVNQAQFDSVQRYIETGIAEGARLVAGGMGRPTGFDHGFFAKPTIFADVAPDMTIAREEIFGPVLAVIPYDTEDEALEIANDSVYGLAGYVFSGDRDKGYRFASGLRAGRISFNGAETNSLTPMGGYKQSGIGRSMGRIGLEEYLEIKSVYGFAEEADRLPAFP